MADNLKQQMETTASFGYWVRRQRKALDLTQASLAAQVGCAAVTIRKIEQDARRPSRQMAERLAECLTIPAGEREAFVQCGLGERPVDALPLPTQPVSEAARPRPAFLATAEGAAINNHQPTFVARERELAQLDEHLAAALAGTGRVVLVTGEAGRGKTALLAEFGRLAQVAHPDLIVAGGNCNAYAGAGDPYLPFRDMMALLAGDIESRWVAGLVTRRQAQRLWDFAPQVIETIMTQGPDLVDIFLPRGMHLGRAGPLQAARIHLEQHHFFEQFANVWQALAAQRPLLVLLDDLQWADAASTNLLFHLGRRLSGNRILIIAAYRPTEVALAGRGQPPALEPLIQEFRRIFGDVQVDLERFEPAANRRLVDSLLDREPNRLPEAFRVALFWRTKGHPLFTVELLREMQARGDLIRDEAGYWIESAALDWERLPARVEAVIEQRIGRLDNNLRHLLAVASVEGETFTAQVLARLQQVEIRPLLHQLSQELQERHGLVREQGEIDVSGHRLARYQFSHGLFQQYLYLSLGQAERRLLHGEIAALLEVFYGEQKENFAVQLAHHYAAAGHGEKAVPYLLQAGDRARALYAHQEAIEHYQRALPFLKAGGDLEGAARTLMKLGLTYHIAFDYERSRQAYEEGFALWQQLSHVRPVELPSPAAATLRLAWQDPNTLDPSLAGTTLSAPIITQLFSGLVAQSQEMEVIPDVAWRWQVLDGGRIYVFHLRDDVFWSDGVPVTAVDFEYTFKRALDPATQTPVAGLLLYGIKGARAFHQGELSDPAQVGITARDEHTLVIELESPISYFLYSLTYYVLLPVPRHVVMGAGPLWTEPAHLVTNGPFRLAAWEPGRVMRLVRNPRYHGRFSGNVQQVELSLGLDTKAQFEAYQDNRLDVVYNWFFSGTDIAPLHRRYPDEYQLRSRLATLTLFFDVSQPPFDDVRVRRAFIQAVDRAALAAQVLQGYEVAATGGLLPPGMPGYLPDIALAYDPAAARDLLAEAGFPQGRDFPPVTFLIFATRQAHAAFLQIQWRDTLGITVNPEIMSPTWFQEQRHHAPPAIFMSGWWADHADPDNFLRVWLQVDLPSWRNPTYEQLLEQARQTVDQAARMQLYQRAERILVQEATLMPLSYSIWHLLIKPWVKQFPTTTVKHPGFWHEVVIDTAHQRAEVGHTPVTTGPKPASDRLPVIHTLRLNWLNPATVDPTLAPGLYSNGLVSQLFSGLVALTPDLDVLPDVAQSWEVTDDGRTTIFHLHPDACWSDGMPVTAADFEYAWKRALNPATHAPLASVLLYDVSGAQAYHRGETADPDQIAIHARDARTLVVGLEQPTGYFPQLVAFPALFPVPRHVVEKEPAWATPGNLVSNGPFTLGAWQPSEAMRLERNPAWHGPFLGNVQQIDLTLTADPSALLHLYQAGDLDILYLSLLPPEVVDRARIQYASEYLSGPQFLTYYLMFNTRQPPFDDQRVRRALALATDRARMADVDLRGYLAPATGGFVPPGMPGHMPGIALPTDVEQARRLLVEAGYGDGRHFPAIETYLRQGRAHLARPLIAQWQQQLGVTLNIHEATTAELYERWRVAPPPLGLAMWIPDYPDPDCYLRVSMGLDAVDIGWQHAGYNTLVQQARQVTSQVERLRLYAQAEHTLVAEAPILPLMYGRLHLLLKPWIRRYRLSPMKQRFWHQVMLER